MNNKTYYVLVGILLISFYSYMGCQAQSSKDIPKEVLDRALVVDKIKKTSAENNRITFTFDIANMSSKEVTGFEVAIHCKGANGNHIHTISADVPETNNKLKAGDKLSQVPLSFEIDSSNSGHTLLYKTPENQLSYLVEVRSIKYADGSQLRATATSSVVTQAVSGAHNSESGNTAKDSVRQNTAVQDKGQTDNSGLSPLQIAMKELGLKTEEDITQLKGIISKDGIEKAKTVLYLNQPRAFPLYVISQKVDKYMIYALRRSNDLMASQLAVIPIPGEFLQKGASLPGEMYQFMGMTSFTGLDGFERSLPLMQRVISESDKKGYGSIPDDATSRNHLVGKWVQSTLWKGESKITFKQNGRVDANFYSLIDEKYEKYDGKWSLRDGVLSLDLTASRERNSSTYMDAAILKLTSDALVLYMGTEETYRKIN